MQKRFIKFLSFLLRIFIAATLLFSYSSDCHAQGTFIPLGSDVYHFADRLEIKSGFIHKESHTAPKPFDRFSLHPLFLYKGSLHSKKIDQFSFNHLIADNLIGMEVESDSLDPSRSLNKPIFKTFYKYRAAFFAVDEEDFKLVINPVFYFQYGNESDVSEDKYINSRGIELRGLLEEKIGFYMFLTDNQMVPLNYVKDVIERDQAVPAEGFYKLFKNNGVDYYSGRGYFTFHATKRIGVQFGYDRNFIGNGYRSLILSDHSNSYGFLKINTKIWKLQYQNLYTELTGQHVRWSLDTLRPKKFAVIHHLSCNLFKNLNIGLFESVVFSRNDAFELQYLNPMIFYRAIEQNLGSPDNALLGLDYKFNFLKHFSLYGQIVLDELNFGEFTSNPGWWGNKFGIQTGLKYIDMLGVSNLDGQVEFNIVRPYTYTFGNVYANYTNYNQPLAHPLGANFKEIIGILRFQPSPKLSVITKVIAAIHGADELGSESWQAFSNDTLTTNGGNIFVSYDKRKGLLDYDFKNSIGQGIREVLLLADVTISYQWKHNLFFDLRCIYRDFNSELDQRDNTTNFVGIAMRLNIAARNFDF